MGGDGRASFGLSHCLHSPCDWEKHTDHRALQCPPPRAPRTVPMGSGTSRDISSCGPQQPLFPRMHSFLHSSTHSFSSDGKGHHGWRAQADPKGPRVSTAKNSRSLFPGGRNEQCHLRTAGAPTEWTSHEIQCRGLYLGLQNITQ